MYAQVEKPKENTSSADRRESRTIANELAQKKSNFKQGLGFVDNRQEAIVQKRLQEVANHNLQVKQFRAYQDNASGVHPIQLMTNPEAQQVLAWQQARGLSIFDYGYNPNTNLVVYYTQIGSDARTIEIHVHLDAGQHGRVQAENMRWKGEPPPGIGLVGTGWGDRIVAECIEYWMPAPPRLDVRQGADL